jgi:hypothetical protein
LDGFPSDDLKVDTSSCRVANGTATASVTVTNHTASTNDYAVGVEFINNIDADSGHPYATAWLEVYGVAPNETASGLIASGQVTGSPNGIYCYGNNLERRTS